jgi:hypothetical protein
VCSFDVGQHVIHDESECSVTLEQRCWSAADIASSPDIFAPRDLGSLLLSLFAQLPSEAITLDQLCSR